jgi:MscS family membrane protein
MTAGCLGLLVLGGAALAAGEEAPRSGPLLSPRATVQTLFTAVGASHENPKYIAEATACLDLGGLPPDRRDAELLAVQLEEVLRAADVNTERIPEEADGDSFAFTGPEAARIGLHRQADGRWLFDRETVAQVPQMDAAARKILQERTKEAAALNVPPEVASPRATFHTFLTSYFRRDNERALRCLNLTDIPAAARVEVGEQLAHKLCQIVLRNRSVIFQDLPDSNYSGPYVWMSLPEGSIELVRLPTGERKGEWVFSRRTVRTIDALYNLFEDRPYHALLLHVPVERLRPDLWRAPELWLRERMPGWSKADLSSGLTFRVEPYQLLGCVLLAALAFTAFRFGPSVVTAVLRWGLMLRRWAPPREKMLKRLAPSGLLFACLLIRSGLFLLDVDKALLGLLITLLNPLVWVCAAWTVFHLIDLIGDIAEVRRGDTHRRAGFAEMLWPVGSLATKIALGVALVLHLMALFAWDVTAVLTGLGIGGVAFALGAQDSLRNLFGSFTLIADRPFVVGETVQIGEGGLGVVERVGLRSTAIRTVEDTLMIVPNSNLTTMNITNFGRRRFRRFTGRIGVAYGASPERLAAFRDAIHRMVLDQKQTRKDQCEVAIHDLTAEAVEIQISVYFDVMTSHEEAAARETLLLGCLRLADEMRIGLAVPTPPAPSNGEDGPTLRLHADLENESDKPHKASA